MSDAQPKAARATTEYNAARTTTEYKAAHPQYQYQAISPVCTGHGLVELCFIAATELPGSKPFTFKAGI